MKTITIFNYNFDDTTNEELKKTKWKHGDVIEDDVMKVVNKLYKKTNLNIMVKRGKDERENHVTLFVTMYSSFFNKMR